MGATTAQCLLRSGCADVVLVDVVEGLARGKALDLSQAGPLEGYDGAVSCGGYEDTGASDYVVITAGTPRKPGMSRDDLLRTNAGIVADAAREAARRSPDCILIVVSNPLDAMAHVALRSSGFPRERVVGMAGVLDSSRFRALIARELGVSARSVQAIVMGGHGDTMVPLPRYTTVDGVPITELMSAETVDRLVEATRGAGAEIVSHLKSGSATYAPAAAIAEMVDAMVADRKKILPCSAYLRGEYGIHDLFVGVPVKLGAGGVESILELDLDDREREMLRRSAESVAGLVRTLGMD